MQKFTALLAILLFSSCAMAYSAETAPKEAQSVFDALIAATADQDYAAFQAQGNPAFQKAIGKGMFDQVCAQVSANLKAGFKASYLASLRQRGYTVYMWKIEMNDGGNDILAKLTLEGGKASGFFLN